MHLMNHTFCRACLLGIGRPEIKCPTCRTECPHSDLIVRNFALIDTFGQTIQRDAFTCTVCENTFNPTESVCLKFYVLLVN